MFDRLKRFGETAGYVAVIAGLFTGFCKFLDVNLPPWVSVADGQAILNRLNKSDVTQRSIQIEILSAQLDRAWDAYRANPKDDEAKANIWRLTRQLKELDPTIPLPPVP